MVWVMLLEILSPFSVSSAVNGFPSSMERLYHRWHREHGEENRDIQARDGKYGT
jgi:hypothetical protein